MVISSCHLKATNGLKSAPEAISEGLKLKNFLGGACPQTPLQGALPCIVPLPPKFSLSIILPQTLTELISKGGWMPPPTSQMKPWIFSRCIYNHWIHTCWGESKLSADHTRIKTIPEVITHCTPYCIIAHFNSTLSVVWSINKPEFTISTVYQQCQKTDHRITVKYSAFSNIITWCIGNWRTEEPTVITHWDIVIKDSFAVAVKYTGWVHNM